MKFTKLTQKINFPICKSGNKQTTQEVAFHKRTVIPSGSWEESIPRTSPGFTGQMAFYKELLGHLFSGQWPAPRVAMTVILALREPKPHIFPVSWAQPKPLYCVPLIPVILEWQERRGVLEMAQKYDIPYLCVAFYFFLFLSIFRGSNIFYSDFFSTPPACSKESPCQRPNSCLHFFHVPVHSKFSFPSVHLLWGLLACNTFFWPGKFYCSSRPGFHRFLHSLWNPAWLLQPWLNTLFLKN